MTGNEITLLVFGYIVGYMFTSKKLTGDYFWWEENAEGGLDLLFIFFWWLVFLYFLGEKIVSFFKDDWHE